MHKFKYESEQKEKKRNPLFLYSFLVSIMVILGFYNLFIARQFYFDSSILSIAIPALFLIMLLLAGGLVLQKAGYKGSYTPFIAMILLLGAGVLIQTRLDKQDYKIITTVSHVTVDNNEPILSGSVKMHLLTSTFAIAAVLLFVGSGNILPRIGRNYLVLFAITVLLLAAMVFMVKLGSGGKFLYSRTPWEPLKIAVTLVLAGFLSHFGPMFKVVENGRMRIPSVCWSIFIVLAAVPLALYIFLGDLGQVMIMGCLLVFLLYLATGSITYPILGAVGVIIAVKAVLLFMPFLPDYAAARLELWSNFWSGFPASEWWDRSYQTANAFFAIKEGGILGQGIGLGSPELVPLSVSDFVYAEIVEELGFIGSFSIILLYLAIINSGLDIASRSPRRFESLVVAGLSMLLTVQVFINIGGVLNIVPLTGIVLPFISKGGFSMITFGTVVGLLMAVSHRNQIEL